MIRHIHVMCFYFPESCHLQREIMMWGTRIVGCGLDIDWRGLSIRLWFGLIIKMCLIYIHLRDLILVRLFGPYFWVG